MCVFILSLLCKITSYSQIEWINFKNSGQYNDAFSSIAFDGDNNPWAGTLLNGIQYFNGTSFQNYNTSNSPLLHNKVYDLIYDDKEDRMLIATLKGLTVFKENIWTNYTTETTNLPSNAILSMAKDEGGRIWFGTDNGVVDGLNGVVYNNENTILKGNLILDICIDSKGNKWFATNEEIAMYDGMNWQTFSSDNSVLPQEAVNVIEEDANGILWASIGNTYSGTLAAFDRESWKIIDQSILNNLSSRISAIETFENGETWFGTHDKGIIQYKDSIWTAYTTDNSEIPINQIINMGIDRENRLWLAHRNGLTRVDPQQVLSTSDYLVEVSFIFPNPIIDKARIYSPFPSGISYNLMVIDIHGQMVRQIKNISNDYVFDREGLEPGIYVVKLYNTKESFYSKIIAN